MELHSWYDAQANSECNHPACDLNYRTWSRTSFMNALTAPLFGNKTQPPFVFVRVDCIPAEGRTNMAHPRIVCEIPLHSNYGVKRSSSLFLTMSMVNMDLPEDTAWIAGFSQETLTRPWCESFNFWGSVVSFQIGGLPLLKWDYLDSAASHCSWQCCLVVGRLRPEEIVTVDLLLTVLVEQNWTCHKDRVWQLACALPHFWVAHAAKFQTTYRGDAWHTVGAPEIEPLVVHVAIQCQGFFGTVHRLMQEFELSALPIRSIDMRWDFTLGLSHTVDFHSVMNNVEKVCLEFDARTWPILESMMRVNFPKLSHLTLNAHTKDSRVPRFLVEHKNSVTYATRRNPNQSAKVAKYVTNARAMRAFTGADARSLRASATPPQIVSAFFASPMFEPYVVHLVDRFVHGLGAMRQEFNLDTPAGRLCASEL